MVASNKYVTKTIQTEAKKGSVYLVATTNKQLYVVKQVGARSWDAFNVDMYAPVTHIHSNRKEIMSQVRMQLQVDYICEFRDKLFLRKAIMEFSCYGTIGETDFEINKVITND